MGAPPGAAAPAKKKGGAGLIIGIIGALVLLVGGGAGAYFLWMRSTGPELAKYVPKDTTMYAEVPSLTKALVSFVGVDWIDDKELDAEAKKDEMAEAFASSFDIDKGDAEDVMKSVSSVGVAFREEKEHDKKGAFMISFSSAGAAEKLFASKRFKEEDDLAGGKGYKLLKREVDEDKAEKMSSAEKFFNELGDRKKEKGEDKEDKEDKKDKSVCVWFESAKVFSCGDEDFVEEVGKVISGDKESLAKANETFAQAKWPAGSTMLVYVDPESFDKDAKKEFFDGTGPVLVSARFADAGAMLTAQAELKGKKLPEENLFDAPGKLTLTEKVPASTVAYLEVSTKTSLEGKELRKKLFKFAGAFGEKDAEDAEKGLDEMKENLGFDLDTVFDALGDEMIIAVTATDKVTVEQAKKKDKDALGELGLVFIAHLRDKDKGEKILKSLKDVAEDKGKSMVDVSKKDDGYLFEVKGMDGMPSLMAAIKDDKYLYVAVGNKKRLDEFDAAFGGENTLKDDKAHAKAMKAFDAKPQAMFWFDAGRAATVALKDDDIKEMVKKGMKEAGIKLEAFVLEGDDRMTMASAISWTVKDGAWTVQSDSLNAFAFAGFGAFAARSKYEPSEDHSDKSDGDSGGGGGGDVPVIGVANCDAYFAKMNKCANKMGGAGGESMKSAMKQAADGMKQAASNPAARSSLDSSCKQMLDALAQNPACN
jgi:hypothetical protein